MNNNKTTRIKDLMTFKHESIKPIVKESVEAYKEAIDGKIYGVIKENNKYYLKIADNSDNVICENFKFIGGEANKNKSVYSSYRAAANQLDLKIKSLNEVNIIKENKSLPATGIGHQELITEEAIKMRETIDRFNRINRNSNNIGLYITEDKGFKVYTPNHPGNPEAHGKSTDPKKEGTPYDNKLTVVESETSDWGLGGQTTATDLISQGTPYNEKPKDGVKQTSEKEIVNEKTLTKTDKYGNKSTWYDKKAPEKNQLPAPPDEITLKEINLGNSEIEDIDIESDGYEDLEIGIGDEMGVEDQETLFDDEMGNEQPDISVLLQTVLDKLTSIESELGISNDISGQKGIGDEMGVEDQETLFDDEIPTENRVYEDKTVLNDFGKHPGYQKKPITLPTENFSQLNNNEKWNEGEDGFGEKAFGTEIGDSTPFVKALTESIIQKLKEGNYIKLVKKK